MEEKSMLAQLFLKVFQWFKPYFQVCRVESWLSWIFSFGLGNVLFGPPLFTYALSLFFAFCFATASIFVLNQYFDRKTDINNQIKSNLPVASGQVSSNRALIFSFFLIFSCFTLVSIVNINLWPFFLIYLAIWTLYSSPYPRLKTIPIADFVTSGIGAGFIPFFIGLSVLNPSNLTVSNLILSTTPLTLFHCGAHIIQTIGDYESDLQAGVNTFVVKYGRKKGVSIAGFMFLSAFLLSISYFIIGFIPHPHLILFFILIPFFIKPLLVFNNLYKNPSSKLVTKLQKSVKKYGTFVLLIAWIYFFIFKYINWSF
jgi:4-hydroxybenzoate polyprenyltransferase